MENVIGKRYLIWNSGATRSGLTESLNVTGESTEIWGIQGRNYSSMHSTDFNPAIETNVLCDWKWLRLEL